MQAGPSLPDLCWPGSGPLAWSVTKSPWCPDMNTLFALLALCEGNPSPMDSRYKGTVMQSTDDFSAVNWTISWTNSQVANDMQNCNAMIPNASHCIVMTSHWSKDQCGISVDTAAQWPLKEISNVSPYTTLSVLLYTQSGYNYHGSHLTYKTTFSPTK